MKHKDSYYHNLRGSGSWWHHMVPAESSPLCNHYHRYKEDVRLMKDMGRQGLSFCPRRGIPAGAARGMSITASKPPGDCGPEAAVRNPLIYALGAIILRDTSSAPAQLCNFADVPLRSERDVRAHRPDRPNRRRLHHRPELGELQRRGPRDLARPVRAPAADSQGPCRPGISGRA